MRLVRVIAEWSTMYGHVGEATRLAPLPNHVMVRFSDSDREYCFGARELEAIDAA